MRNIPTLNSKAQKIVINFVLAHTGSSRCQLLPIKLHGYTVHQ